MMIDILAMMHDGKIDLDQAYEIKDDTISRMHRGEITPEWWTALGLSRYEVTALAQAAPLAELVKLRYDGWSEVCSRCGQPLDYRQFGWWYVTSDDGIPRLRHIVCPVQPGPPSI